MSLKINVSLKTNDKMWRSMVRNLTKGGDKTSVIGWWNSMHPTGVPVAQVAQWNEEGHENGKGSRFPGTITPSRPFMTKGFVPQIQKVLPEFVSKAHQVAMGLTTWGKVNHEMGWKLKETLQNVIEAWNQPPNSPLTVSIKGSNNPLIDTGTMLDTVQAKVIRKGGKI